MTDGIFQVTSLCDITEAIIYIENMREIQFVIGSLDADDLLQGLEDGNYRLSLLLHAANGCLSKLPGSNMKLQFTSDFCQDIICRQCFQENWVVAGNM